MAGELDTREGGGDAGAAQGGAGAGGAQPQPGTAAGGAGSGANQPAGNEGGAGKPLGLDPSILPPSLQGKSESELKFILKQMPDALRKLQQDNENLKKQLSGGGDKPKPKEDEKPSKPYEERILDDPEGTIAEIVQKRFGGVIEGLDRRTARSELNTARQELDDFSEHEEEVLSVLEDAGAPATYENIAGAYTMVIGQKTLEEKRRARQQPVGMEQGGNAPAEGGDKKVKMTDLEREVARVHGMSEEQWAAARDGDVLDQIKVPTGRAKESA